MTQGSSNPFPIQVLVNYWEKPINELGSWLDGLSNSGVRRLSALIPWHCFETDLSHSLRRFIQAAAERKMEVLLIPSLEPAVHYPYSGIPKEWVSGWETLGASFRGSPSILFSAPQVMGVPSFFQPEFTKKFYQHLTKVDAMVADLARTDSKVAENIRVGLTGSFWKYFRSPEDSVESPFGGRAGDYSQHSAANYRQHLESFFGQKEFQSTDSTVIDRFRSKPFEDIHRRIFFQSAEDQFRVRQAQSMSRRALNQLHTQLELFTPECDPAFQYTAVFSEVAEVAIGFERLDRMLDESISRRSSFEGRWISPWVRWLAGGAFDKLSDAQKQYLFLKSLVLFGGAGGGIVVDEALWMSLKDGFRRRCDALARGVSSGKLKTPSRAVYLSPHLWSNFGNLWQEMAQRTFPWCSVVTNVDAIVAEREAELVIVDPQVILNRETVSRLLSLTKIGRIVVLPKSRVYTDAARRELDGPIQRTQAIDMDFGLRYQIFPLGEGKIIFYEIPEIRAESLGELQASLKTFLAGITSLAGIRSPCRVKKGGKGMLLFPVRFEESMALFILNSTGQAGQIEIEFREEKRIADLFQKLEESPSRTQGSDGMQLKTLDLEVPAMGILSLAVQTVKDLEARDDFFNPEVDSAHGNVL